MKRSRPAQQQLLKHRVEVEMVKLLGSLPVIHKFCRRLQVAEIVDRLCPKRDLQDILTHGQVVEALIANRLTSPLPLYEIEGWAEVFAVEEVFGIRPEQLNDDCLGAALDALAPQVEGVRGSVGLSYGNTAVQKDGSVWTGDFRVRSGCPQAPLGPERPDL